GLAYADDDRIEIQQNAFAGVSASVSFIVHGETVSEITQLEGTFSFVTNGGDLRLPYQIHFGQLISGLSAAPATIADLGELAEKRPESMLGLFESPQFTEMPFLKDDSLRSLYLSLRRSPDRRLALEEFLVACGAKKPLKLSVDREPQTYVCREDSFKGEIVITKSGQGYCLITVRSEAPFLHLRRERWTASDFDGDLLRIPLQFVGDKLHGGKNPGTVVINTGREEVRVSVTVIPERKPDVAGLKRSQYRRASLQLAKSMVLLYAAQNRPRGVEAQVLKYLDVCDDLKEADTQQNLLRAEILRQLRLRREEKEILEQNRAQIQRNRTENVSQYLWFLYLEEEMEKGNRLSESFLRLLYRLKEEEAEKVELLPLLIRSDSEWAEQPEKCYQKIKEHFGRGKLPLLLLIEAVLLVNRNPELIRRTDRFTRYLLVFGARYGCWNEETADRSARLLALQKEYHVSYERILRLLYAAYPTKTILTALLTVILRRGEMRPADRELFARGISEDVRLPELYEAYLASLPEEFEEDIPQMVQLYYTYNSPERTEACRSLYRYILRQYGPETQMYRLYEKQIQTFALEQLFKGDVSDQAGFFYEKMLIPEVLDEKTAESLSEIVYTVHLSLSNKAIQRILVLYGELQEEFAYPVRDGEAFLPIYTPYCRLLFVDRDGNRFGQSVFTRKHIMTADEKLLEAIRQYSPDSLPFRLSLCQKAIRGSANDLEVRELIRRYESWNDLSDVYREKLIVSLIRQHDLNDAEYASLMMSLRKSPYLEPKAGRLLAENFLQMGEEEAAVEMVHRFGYRSFDPQMLLRLLDRQIRSRNYEYDKALFEVALSLYRSGEYSPVTLTCLCRYFNGGTDDMRELLSRASGGNALYYDLPERLLGQMIFTEETERIEWVVDLYLKGTKVPNRQLLHAYAVLQSERYFCREEAVPENIFAYLASWAASEKRPEMLPLICQMALTKFYSEKESLSPDVTKLAGLLLQNLYDQGKFFLYQQKLGRFFPLPAELADKTLIEYRGSENEPVSIGIRILPQEEDEAFQYSEMPHVYRGIYVKPVLLFADEKLEYRIERSGELIGEGSLTGGAENAGGRFARLNRVIQDAVEGREGWQEEIVSFGKEDGILKDYFHTV
ncbi:MAG: hypothetical protein J5496_05870, partial [Lachnospiraceae bacterium]|nr:hypothetical protein [Lachnospiraceae bacterium]